MPESLALRRKFVNLKRDSIVASFGRFFSQRGAKMGTFFFRYIRKLSIHMKYTWNSKMKILSELLNGIIYYKRYLQDTTTESEKIEKNTFRMRKSLQPTFLL